MNEPAAWSSAGRRRAQNRRSAHQEAKHAKAVSGRVQAGSGSSWSAKGDVRSEEFMDELKMTAGRGFGVTTTIINKIIKAAAQSGREPRLIVDYSAIGVRMVCTFEDIP